jgi:hypothetical protein
MKKIIIFFTLLTLPLFASLFGPSQSFTAPFLTGINTKVDTTSVYIDEDKVSWEKADNTDPKSASAWIMTSKSLKNNFVISYQGKWKLGLTDEQVSELEKRVETFQPDTKVLNSRLNRFKEDLINNSKKPSRLFDLSKNKPIELSPQEIELAVSKEKESLINAERKVFAENELYRLQRETIKKLSTDKNAAARLKDVPIVLKNEKTKKTQGYLEVSKIEGSSNMAPTLSITATSTDAFGNIQRSEYPKIIFKAEYNDELKRDISPYSMKTTLFKQPNQKLGSFTIGNERITKGLGEGIAIKPIIDLSQVGNTDSAEPANPKESPKH